MRFLPTSPFRLPRLSPYEPSPSDPLLFGFNNERDAIIEETARRVAEQHSKNRHRLEQVLNDAAYNETRRLSHQHDQEARESLGFWRGLVRRVGRMSDDEKRGLLLEISRRMAKDVAGNFDPRVYKWSERVTPRLITAVMKPTSLPFELLAGGEESLDEALLIEGEIEKLRVLARKGTLVFVPTHVSNMDSVVFGYGLMRAGLPPVIYGAGKNLFTNPIISFFMHNLGAYRVDRRVKAHLYKEVLKAYSSVVLERGYHSLFFPGGTRSRSGLIENRLKLGLAGSAVEAFARNGVADRKRPLWFVPATINYALVLEAETLIEDHLSEHGRARYIIEDDEFSRLERWIAFLRKLTSLKGACIIRFGAPIDPFGNDVDEEGRSITPHGRVIDPVSYVMRRGAPVLDPQRDAAYTRDLGETLVERFAAETVVMATQLVAHVLFRRLVRATPGVDLFTRIRHRGDVTVPREELVREVSETRDALLDLVKGGKVHASPTTRLASPEEIVSRVLAAWNGYHRRVAARDNGIEVIAEDPTMLLYYQNRLVPFAERIADASNMHAAREIAQMERMS